MTLKIGFVQPFGLSGPGGGAKILRSMIVDQPFEWRSVSTYCSPPQPLNLPGGKEIWVPYRPVTRLDRTRLKWLADMLDSPFAPNFKRRLRNVLEQEQFDAIHVVPHSVYDWQIAADFCRNTRTPLLMSVHDGIRFSFGPRAYRTNNSAFAAAWQSADELFCITEELGEEYCRRYGKRKYEILTDGVNSVADSPRPVHQLRLHVYFCGMLHFAYVENFLALCEAIDSLHGLYDVKLIVRGGLPFRPMKRYKALTEYRPFSHDISRDMDDADVLYLPLPFGSKYDEFVQFSLSTKAISYLASGVPILYHGPEQSALYHLLNRNNAAGAALSNSRDAISAAIQTLLSPQGRRFAENAIHLAKSQFSLSRQQECFWLAVQRQCGTSVERVKQTM